MGNTVSREPLQFWRYFVEPTFYNINNFSFEHFFMHIVHISDCVRHSYMKEYHLCSCRNWKSVLQFYFIINEDQKSVLQVLVAAWMISFNFIGERLTDVNDVYRKCSKLKLLILWKVDWKKHIYLQKWSRSLKTMFLRLPHFSFRYLRDSQMWSSNTVVSKLILSKAFRSLTKPQKKLWRTFGLPEHNNIFLNRK